MSNESDALLVARWCWPEPPEWLAGADGHTLARALAPDGEAEWISAENWKHVHAAELVLIDRGLGERYGNALCRLTVQSERYPEGSVGEWAVTLATAPLDVRVRAMAATIRAHSPLTTPYPPR